ncbi:MAG: glutamine-hydrolyzing carbamoyl-phosphate synthase small subunit [Anaerolineae bacterium]|nr:glutamine-hydrolyzing carbamoyl-phosphate synthase small subunit [Anaerolineae bacterium]
MTQKPQTALLVLEDGTTLWGKRIGAAGETFGELVFNTSMTGYQEVLTDPSYCGQIVVMTYPEIGIYGVNPDDVESERIQVAGYVVHRAVRQPFNYRATLSFTDYLEQAGIVAIEGVDTRMLTRHLRTHGAMRGAISTVDLDPAHLLERVRQSPQMLGLNLAEKVSPVGDTPVLHPQSPPAPRFHVALIDTGRKENIARELMRRGCAVTLLPYNADLKMVLSLNPDGVFVCNGPGDPDPLRETIEIIRGVLERGIPLAGICLGHQLLGLAIGGTRYKMRFGHRGINHPVRDFRSGRILITTQNHGFAVDPTSLGIAWEPLDTAFVPSRPEVLNQRSTQHATRNTVTMAELLPQEPLIGESPLGFGKVEITHLSLNDGTVEGMRLLDLPAFSVQYHPEAAPGPHDAKSFFEEFIALMESK